MKKNIRKKVKCKKTPEELRLKIEKQNNKKKNKKKKHKKRIGQLGIILILFSVWFIARIITNEIKVNYFKSLIDKDPVETTAVIYERFNYSRHCDGSIYRFKVDNKIYYGISGQSFEGKKETIDVRYYRKDPEINLSVDDPWFPGGGSWELFFKHKRNENTGNDNK